MKKQKILKLMMILVIVLAVITGCKETEQAKEKVEVTETVETPIEIRELSIDNLVFSDFIDEDFNFVQKKDATFILGNPVYIYFEISGFEQKDGRIALMQDLEVIGPDGEVVLDEKGIVVINYQDLQEKASYVPLKNIVRIPQSYEEGDYKVKITITDKLTGKKVTAQSSFQLLDEFNIGSIAFASYIDEDYNYDRKETPVYKIGEPVYIYFEIYNYETIPEAEGRRVNLSENIITRNEAGNVVEKFNIRNHIFEGVIGPEVTYIRYQEKFETTGLEPGSYSMEVSIFDGISQQKISKIAKFDLVK